jgi:purine-binding chemotaxis protein CheW
MSREDEVETAGSGTVGLVTFSLDDRKFAVPLASVVRVERVVAVTPLPQAPAIITGIVDFHGQVIPVADIRQRFGIPSRPVELKDQLLLLSTQKRTVAFLVDVVEGSVELPAYRLVDTETVIAGLEYVRGVLKLENGMVLIHDPETFLSLEEERTLDEALQGAQPEPASPADGQPAKRRR